MLRLHGMHTLHIDRFYKINYNTIRMMLSFTHLNPPHLIYCVRNMDVDPKECIFSLRIFVEFLCDDVCVGFSVSFIPVWCYLHVKLRTLCFFLAPHSTIERLIDRTNETFIFLLLFRSPCFPSFAYSLASVCIYGKCSTISIYFFGRYWVKTEYPG